MDRIVDMLNSSKRVMELNRSEIESRKEEQRKQDKVKNDKNKERRKQLYDYNRLFNSEYIRLRNTLNSEKRRSVVKSLPTNINLKLWRRYLDVQFDGKCPLTGSDKIHIDHFIPLSWGHGGTYIGNIIPLSDHFNLSKHAKNPFIWAERRKIDVDKFNSLVEHLASLNQMTSKEFRDYVFWCEKNKRNEEQIRLDGNVTSVELWNQSPDNLKVFCDFVTDILRMNKKVSIDTRTIKKLCKESKITYHDIRREHVKKALGKNKVIIMDHIYLKLKR